MDHIFLAIGITSEVPRLILTLIKTPSSHVDGLSGVQCERWVSAQWAQGSDFRFRQTTICFCLCVCYSWSACVDFLQSVLSLFLPQARPRRLRRDHRHPLYCAGEPAGTTCAHAQDETNKDTVFALRAAGRTAVAALERFVMLGAVLKRRQHYLLLWIFWLWRGNVCSCLFKMDILAHIFL